MAVPGYQEFMLPLLMLAADGKEHTITEAIEALALKMGVSEEEQDLMLPSGTQTILYNRVTWATTYLTKSLLLEKVGRGKFRIAPRGTDVLNRKLSRIDNKFLEQFPEYMEFKHKKRPGLSATATTFKDLTEKDADTTPEEQLEAAYEELREALADDLLRRVRTGTPKFFEHLVVRVLLAMGYGKGQIERAKVTGKSGDEGIDGVIPQDRLELDMVYIQAKRHENAVGPGDIDKFVGSLMRKKANKGVFITSGSFTDGAVRAAKEAAVKLRLVDGDELAELMIDYNVGVSVAETYVVKKVDTDFFEALPQ